ncbi:unnamed protein product, partial [marine sediment metagenome]
MKEPFSEEQKASPKTLKEQIKSLKEMYNKMFENENRSSEWYDNLLAIVHCQINDLDTSVEGLVAEFQKRFDEKKKKLGGVCGYGELIEEFLEALGE